MSSRHLWYKPDLFNFSGLKSIYIESREDLIQLEEREKKEKEKEIERESALQSRNPWLND